MKIVHLGPSVLPVTYRFGGAVQRRMLEIAKAQARRGDEVIIYSADGEQGRTENDAIEIRKVACRHRAPWRDIEYLRKALGELQNEQVDVLHFHGLAEGAAYAKRVQATKLLSFDNFLFRRGKRTPLYWWYRRALREFSYLLPVSEYCKRQFQAYWGSDGVPIRVLHNGVNLEQFSPDSVCGLAKKRALGIENKRVILYVGRVCPQKGTDLLIEAYREVRAVFRDVSLVVAGPAEQFGNGRSSNLTRRISEVGGVYLGPVAEQDLPSIYNLCDVFVMPTRSLEMFGMAALEAQACGKPVVCSNHGGLPEVVSPQSGLFFSVGNSRELAGCLRQLLLDASFYLTKAEASRHNALRFGWSKIAAQIAQI